MTSQNNLVMYLVYPNSNYELSSVVVADNPNMAKDIFNLTMGNTDKVTVLDLSKSLMTNGYKISIDREGTFH